MELSASAGLELDPWQQSILAASLGVGDDLEKWAAFETGLIVPRQDGKGAVLEARELAGLYLFDDERLLIHTAHEFKTAQEHFYRIASLVEALDHKVRDPGKRIKSIPTAHGKEAILLEDGTRLRFLARSKGSGRGFSGDLVILDEAMKLPVESMGALLPTMAARANPQVWYTATAGDDEAEVLAGVRDRGIEGDDPALCYVEYSAGDPDDHAGDRISLDDRAEWFRSNPAMHGESPRITEEFVERERRALSDEQFARERLCLWTVGRRQSVIDPDVWQGLIEKSQPGESVCFAVDVPPERTSASIAVASERPDGKKHVEVVDRREGTGWVIGRLKELDEKWKPQQIAVQPSSPAGSLIDEITEALKKERVPVMPVTGTDLSAACGQFLDGVNDGDLVIHDGPHTAALTAAADAARKREFVDGGFSWHRRDTASDIAPLMAATLAAFAVVRSPKKKRKSGKAAF